ncbi:DUF4190 domain-containing protein [Sulfurimonas marina]|uniref:DUF4190 domain-containing protein n=1 Tax=Sulfurimonas marina TaxID=2590551 RepID=A0A7M1AX30_9BACT|nr:DUF4190 domain-containing protein [Sulfurimonas marina]QOP42013.1 DUF4190 domain-containing protein [Sulfurimonas marina]
MEQTNQNVVVVQTSGMAIASMILGIVGLFFFGSLLAVIFGHIARSKIKHSNGTLSGDGLALTGLITGYIGLIFTILILLAVALPKFAQVKHEAEMAQQLQKSKSMSSPSESEY